MANRLIKGKHNGTLAGPVILIGHSSGVLGCCKITEKLSYNGSKVAYTGALDQRAASFSKFEQAEQQLEASYLGQCVVTSVTLKLICHHLEPSRLSGVY